MNRYAACCIAGLMASAWISAQAQESGPSFEVASIKLATDVQSLPFFVTPLMEARMRMQGGPGTKSPERINYDGVTLKMLLQRAYGVKPEQVAGPDWISTQRYTITAKLPPGTSSEQLRLMLQGLLNERFQIRLHRETKPFHVYHLTVSKNGPKLKPAQPAPSADREVTRAELGEQAKAGLAEQAKFRDSLPFRPSGYLGMRPATMAEFTDRLSGHVDRPVIDGTQLEGRYEFTLAWVADGAKRSDDAPQGPSLFAALEEQLGLQLKAATEQLPVIVLDAAEKIPTEN